MGLAAATYDYRADIRRFRDLPTYPAGANSTALRRRSAEDGVRVLLSGVGGDEWFFGNPGRWTDWLSTGHWWLLWQELKTWRYSATDPTEWRDLALTTVHPLIPDGVQTHRARHAPQVRALSLDHAVVCRETSLLDRLRQMPSERGPTHAITGMIRGVLHGGALAAWEDQERMAARYQQDERMPYFDRRVVQFALALPETLRSRPGCPKYLTRRAWAQHAAAGRAQPAGAGRLHVSHRQRARGPRADSRGSTILSSPTSAGSIATSFAISAVDLFDTAHTSREYIGYAWPLWSVMMVDQWYRDGLPAPRQFDTPAAIAPLGAFG